MWLRLPLGGGIRDHCLAHGRQGRESRCAPGTCRARQTTAQRRELEKLMVALGRFLVGGVLLSSGAHAPQLPTFSEEPFARVILCFTPPPFVLPSSSCPSTFLSFGPQSCLPFKPALLCPIPFQCFFPFPFYISAASFCHGPRRPLRCLWPCSHIQQSLFLPAHEYSSFRHLTRGLAHLG